MKGLGDLQKMQQQAQQMQRALQDEEVVVDRPETGVRVVLRGDQQVKEVVIDGILENRVADAINEAVKKTQELAARKFIEMSQQDQG
ncbi:hypothetical protein A3I56_04560 [Candidatus Roizmanbacteria bacterium RIFCSPLOWO2_02_FULL_43_10]|uniref:Nucleoid-associated protein, YbaB/EbfC family n=1 Tax=Candidatus Roizmanbacteria bacterium RIFCSPLOWO2_02_FULL_43_10 TaxID=1802078 RepID=A0A1F7JTF3_9BACT|nr:MAG: hypothetical protein A3I56_04560 [Candidatus Roizmanbacteria bacterium RIFCSPLOWO2_02_FULL_43_10]